MSAAASGAPLLSVSSQMSRHQLRVFVPSLLQQCGHRHSQIYLLNTLVWAAWRSIEHCLLIIIPTKLKSCSPLFCIPQHQYVCLYLLAPPHHAGCCSTPPALCLAAEGCSDFSAPLECQMQMMDRAREEMADFRL